MDLRKTFFSKGEITVNSISVQQTKTFNIKKFILDYAVYVLIFLVVIVYSCLTPLFLSANNLKALFTNSSPLLIAAVGITFVLIIAEIDLSIGSIAGIVGAVWLAVQMRFGMDIVTASLIAVVLAAVLGALNATLIVTLKINSFLATLGMQIFLRGFIYLSTNGSQLVVPKAIKNIFAPANFGGISPLIILSLLIAVAMTLLFKFTSFGRKVQAVGCNANAAKKIGINVSRTKFLVFVLCATLAGIAGIVQVCNVGIASPSAVGLNLEFLAITAAVLGGVSLLGGTGTIVPGVLVGVIFLMCIENGLGLLGANPYVYPVIRGVVIYLAMVSDSLKRSIGNK
jgi:ribose/xylose/arabinose/galactoside ABC-type transport system permease subunit